jgi:Tol biopolymer transport system component
VTLYIHSLSDSSTRELAKSDRLRGLSVSPDGKSLIYSIAFAQDAQQNGLWFINTDGTGRKKLDFFGAFQWRDAQRLVYVPLDLNAPSHIFYEYSLPTGAQRELTDPQTESFRISNGDWSLSPDGNKIVFVKAQDRNLWLIQLPPAAP